MSRRRPRPLFVSIDWDFFVYNASQAADATQHTARNEQGEDVPLLWLFDWQMSESRGPHLQDVIWQVRAAAFRQFGLKIEEVASICPARGCTPWRQFVDAVNARFRCNEAPLWFADSHAWGLFALQDACCMATGMVDVLLFDAHADLGYDTKEVEAQARRNQADCSSWLWHGLVSGRVGRATIVYPDWRHLVEWEAIRQADHVKRLGDRVRALTWTTWLQETASLALAPFQREVLFINVARSGTWVPPHMDEEFLLFLQGVSSYDQTCLDCWKVGHPAIGPYDACQVRPSTSLDLYKLKNEASREGA